MRAGTEIYSSRRWRMIRARHLKANPWCARHLAATGIKIPAVDVHHKRPLSAGGSLDDPNNLESDCHVCHSQLTRAETTDSPVRPPKPPKSDVDPETGIREGGWW